MNDHPSGDCFVVAAKLLLDDPTRTLVHGWPVGSKDTSIEGRRHWHAWVESAVEVEFPNHPHPVILEEVIDNSNGRTYRGPRELYYKVGRIEQTWRYCFDEASQLMDETGTYGPWVNEDPPGGTWRLNASAGASYPRHWRTWRTRSLDDR